MTEDVTELEGEDRQCIKEDESDKDADETTWSGSEDGVLTLYTR